MSQHQNSQNQSNISPSLSTISPQALPTFPRRPPPGSNTKQNLGETAKKRAEPEDKNPHFLYTRLLLYLMRPVVVVDRWSPLTTRRPAAAIQVRLTASPAMHLRYFYALCPSCCNPPYFCCNCALILYRPRRFINHLLTYLLLGLETGSEYAGLHTLRSG